MPVDDRANEPGIKLTLHIMCDGLIGAIRSILVPENASVNSSRSMAANHTSIIQLSKALRKQAKRLLYSDGKK